MKRANCRFPVENFVDYARNFLEQFAKSSTDNQLQIARLVYVVILFFFFMTILINDASRDLQEVFDTSRCFDLVRNQAFVGDDQPSSTIHDVSGGL